MQNEKNGQYVGVDEKYIPEDEKYIDNSTNEEIKDSINDGLLSVKDYVTNKDNQEKIKKAGRKGFKIFKGAAVGYLVFFAIIVIFVIFMIIFAMSNIIKMNNKVDKMSEQSTEIQNRSESVFDEINQ